MKTFTVILLATALSVASCSKDKLPQTTDQIASGAGSGSGKVEDNPNGGGGNNINAAAVPAAVRTAFASRYPNATAIQWKLRNGQYKAEFFIGTIKWQAIFSPTGTLLKQERA